MRKDTFLVGFLLSLLTINVLFAASLFLVTDSWAWSNGGYSSDPANPDYGTHDWIAQHALDWLPVEEKQYILDNLAAYLYGTELPDNGGVPDGIGDTLNHHIYYNLAEILTDDVSAVKELLKEFKLSVITFEQLGPAFKRNRMVEAFNAVNASDGAVILLGKKFSANVYAEMIEILRALDQKNVWICTVAGLDSEREQKQSEILEDIEQFHQIHYYPDTAKLREILRDLLTTRLNQLKEMLA